MSALKENAMQSKRGWLFSPVVGAIGLAIFAACCWPGDTTLPVTAAVVTQSFPHDSDAFTQGFAIEDGLLFEGTGKYGQSSLRRVELNTGRVLKLVRLENTLFGEGITILGDKIYQLTWKARKCRVYDKSSLQVIEDLPYRWKRARDGWGIACDGKQLFVSDGSYNIIVVDPVTLKEIRRMRISDGRLKLDHLNELEYVEGELLANVWYSDRIARIDPETGKLKGWIDCSTIYPSSQRPDREHVLNGIAYDSKAKRLFVTGKNWPKVYEIKVEGLVH